MALFQHKNQFSANSRTPKSYLGSHTLLGLKVKELGTWGTKKRGEVIIGEPVNS